jgi:hypothetical protein
MAERRPQRGRKEGSNEPRMVAGDPERTRRWRWRCEVTTTAVAGSMQQPREEGGRERLRNEAWGIYGALCWVGFWPPVRKQRVSRHRAGKKGQAFQRLPG